MTRSIAKLTGKTPLLRERVSDEEWQLRCRLAAAHRLIALPGEPQHFLVKADNVFMEQVTASNLVKYDVDGNQVMASDYKTEIIHDSRIRHIPRHPPLR